MMTTPLNQRGFSLIGAIFVMVILAALGGYMMRISSSQHIAAANAVEGSRAYYAAKSGLEWAVARLDLSNPATDSLLACANDVNAQTIAYTSGALDGFSVDILCGSSNHTEQPNTYAVFVVESRSYKTSLGAGALGSLGYVSRYMKAKMTDAP